MEAVISAIAGDLISRVTSFLLNKYTENATIDDKLERSQQLLLRIHAVVEEADRRHINNSRMLMQLKMLAASMYQGYHTLDMFVSKSLLKNSAREERTTSLIPLWKRSRTIPGTVRNLSESNTLQSLVQSLEGAIGNMAEFVVLLGGCEPMCPRPYDSYLYIDNFMFGRHVERQHIINTLLQDPESHGAPTVLPVTGGVRVGKKTLVFHVCKNDRIRTRYSSIVFINGDSISVMDYAKFSCERTLVIVEFISDMDDEDWQVFYSTVTRMTAEGSKIIIVSRNKNLARFGTVKGVYLNRLTHEEYSYLFKMLAFGSADQKDYPRLALIANELAILLHGSLVTANTYANLLRRNLDLKFWLHIVHLLKGTIHTNLSKCGQHPKDMLDGERPIDISNMFPSITTSLFLMPPQVEMDDFPKRNLAYVSMGDLITGNAAVPDNEFALVMWESRIPPYTRYFCVAKYFEENNACTMCTRRRPLRI